MVLFLQFPASIIILQVIFFSFCKNTSGTSEKYFHKCSWVVYWYLHPSDVGFIKSCLFQMSSVKSSMVFVIHSNLPSVHLLLLTHPAFILPKLPSCSLVSVYASACSCLITNLNLILIYPNSVCLILNHASKPLLTLYFLVCFLFVCLFV